MFMLIFQTWMPNLSSSVSQMQRIQSILTLKHAGNTEIYNEGLILVNFSQRAIVAQPVSDKFIVKR